MKPLITEGAAANGNAATCKIITVPLDGSAQAEQVLPLAVRLTRSLAARLQLVRVVKTDTSFVNHDDFANELKIVNQAKDYLEKIKAVITDPALPVHLNSDQVREEVVCGRATEEIARFASLSRSSLVVMTTHARSAIPNLLLGSVARKVVQNSGQPVILLRPTQHDTPPTLREQMAQLGQETYRQRRIVVALDGTPEAEAVLAPVIELARAIDATVFLLKVVVPSLPIQYAGSYYAISSKIETDIELERTTAYDYLEKVRQGVISQNVRCVCVVRVGTPVSNPAQEIVDYTEKAGAILLAMATHAKGNLGRIVFGSVSDEVIRQTLRPALLVHPVYTGKVENAVRL